MERDTEYTIRLRGKTFYLTKSQIEFDSPNYFTMCFLGNFREAQTRRLSLSRSPELFEIIVDYLSGRKVLPLDQESIPAHMSPETALAKLRTEAVFYQLDGLIQAGEELPCEQDTISDDKYMALLAKVYHSDGMEIGNVHCSPVIYNSAYSNYIKH